MKIRCQRSFDSPNVQLPINYINALKIELYFSEKVSKANESSTLGCVRLSTEISRRIVAVAVVCDVNNVLIGKSFCNFVGVL